MLTKFLNRPHRLTASAGILRLFGLGVVGLIMLGNVVAFTGLGSRLDYDNYRQPPGISWIQRLLYDADVRMEAFAGEDAGDLESLFTESKPLSTEAVENDLRVFRLPAVTAVVGQPYRFVLQIAGAEAPVRYRLQRYPEGMSIDEQEGAIVWTPAASQNAAQVVEIEAVDAANQGLRMTYTLHTSEVTHALGTDALGRDIFSLLIMGTQWALLPGLVVAGIALGLGVLLGAVGAYYGGSLGQLGSLIAAASETLPALILLFLAALIFDYRLYPVMAVLGVILFPGVAREVGARVTTLASNQFIEAARELGLSDRRILWVDIVWYNARSLLISKFFVILGIAVAMEVTLSYLKLGVQPPEISWGNMIFEGRRALNDGRYALFLLPSIATMLTVFGYYSLGRSFTDTMPAGEGGV